jgi:hypothetical protein
LITEYGSTPNINYNNSSMELKDKSRDTGLFMAMVGPGHSINLAPHTSLYEKKKKKRQKTLQFDTSTQFIYINKSKTDRKN